MRAGEIGMALSEQINAGRGIILEPGLGGGGKRFVRWLADTLEMDLDGDVPTETRDGLEWTAGPWRLVDSASTPTPTDRRARSGRVELSLDGGEAQPMSSVSIIDIVMEFYRSALLLDDLAAGRLMDQIGLATSIADSPELASVASGHRSRGYHRRVEQVIRQAQSFNRHLRSMQAEGGRTLFDLVRVVYLLAPEPMHLGDEWADIASANANRRYSLADINQVLSDFSELFKIDSLAAMPTVEAVNPFVRTIFSGYIPSSNSEYYQLYRWMSSRAVESLVRSDPGDSFIRRSLPLIASRGNAMSDLLGDGSIMLACDITVLVDYLERDPSRMVQPGAKALLLHSHRMENDGIEREAQMEFALRRLSLFEEADRIADALPERAWRPVWSSTAPTNVHRVLHDGVANVLAIDVIRNEIPFRAYAGFSDGSIGRVGQYGCDILFADAQEGIGEARDIAAGSFDGVDYVAAVSSDGAVRAYRVDEPTRVPGGRLEWSDSEFHEGPLSTVALWGDDLATAVVLSGGVGGTVSRHELATGRSLGALCRPGVEVRGIRPVRVDQRDIVVIVTVDGRIALFDLETGDELATSELAEELDSVDASWLTPARADAAVIDGILNVVVGSATGEVFGASWKPGEQIEVSELDLGIPRSGISGVNAVTLMSTGDRALIYVARNDGIWLRFDASDPRPLKVFVGHIGPVLSQGIFAVPGSDEWVSLTGGSEGTIRVWRHIETVVESLNFLRVNRHQGAVRAIELGKVGSETCIVTGGDDGDVRLWSRNDANQSRILAHHQGAVTSFLWLGIPSDSRLVTGASDGSLRLADVDTPTAGAGSLLGIAHEGITSLAPDPEEGTFWSAGNDGAVTRWDALAGIALGTSVICQYGSVGALATDHAGLLYVGGQDGSLSVVDAVSMEVLYSRRFESAVVSLDIIPELHLLVVAFASGRVGTIDLSVGLRSDMRDLAFHDQGVVAVRRLHLYGQAAVATVGRDRRLVVVDVNSRSNLHEIILEGRPTGLSSDGGFIAASTTAGATLFEFFEERLFVARADISR